MRSRTPWVRPAPSDLRILFWERTPGRRPQDFIRRDVPAWARRLVARVLAGGEDLAAYTGLSSMGWATCRICGARLGTRDLVGYGLVWPERAEHYVLEHDVWTPGCILLLERVAQLGLAQ